MNLPKNLRRRSGFTLVELIIVIMIIGILAATVLPKIMGAPAQARDRGRMTELNSLEMAFQSYFNDNGAYPPAAAGECLASNSTTGTLLVNGKYLMRSNFPMDPVASNTTGAECTAANSGRYFYKSLTSMGIPNAAFLIMADVENDGQANADWSDVDAETSRENVDAEIDGYGGASTGTEAVYVKIGT